MSKMHHHDCDRPGCENRVECADSNLERNHDGFPEVICRNVHLPGGSMADVLCEDCEGTPSCDHCGHTATRTERPPSGTDHYCEACYQREVVDYDPTPWDQADVTSGVSASERHDPTHPRNLEAWRLKR